MSLEMTDKQFDQLKQICDFEVNYTPVICSLLNADEAALNAIWDVFLLDGDETDETKLYKIKSIIKENRDHAGTVYSSAEFNEATKVKFQRFNY